MAPPSIFRRPGSRGAPAAAFPAMGLVPVRTEAELQQAIGRYAAAGVAGEAQGVRSGLGCEIVVAGPLSITTPIVIPSTCNGLIIRGAGLVPITAAASMAHMFLINGQKVRLRDLMCLATSQEVAAAMFVQIGDEDFAGAGFLAQDCYVVADRVFDDPEGRASGARLVRIEHEILSDTPAGDPVVRLNANECLVEGGNYQDGLGDTVQMGASAARCRVIGADLGGGDVTTTGSGGFHTVIGNTGRGTITLVATDRPALPNDFNTA